MNNVVNNPRTLSRLWAALNCDFESLLTRYMAGKGWRYRQFAKVCREMQITLIMHITQGRGKTKDEHYNRITDMIFQMCKDLWLRSFEVAETAKKSAADLSMELKRAMGSFYLLYTMYEKQPCRDRVKISLGICDMAALNKFCESIKIIPWKEEIYFMLSYLEEKKAFHYCVYAEEYRFDAATRNFLNISRSEVVQLTKKMRDCQDVLAYSDVHSHCEKSLEELSILKNSLARDMQKTINPSDMLKHMSNQSAFSLFFRTVTSENLKTAIKKLDQLLDKPVMTLQTLTATEAIDRRLMMETRRRMERARKKSQVVVDRDGEHRTVRPYVREGGIFGRKKETEEGDDRTKRRERGACNGNLWIYINGHDFDKPMMSNPTRHCPQPGPQKAGPSGTSAQAEAEDDEEVDSESDEKNSNDSSDEENIEPDSEIEELIDEDEANSDEEPVGFAIYQQA